VPANPTLPQPCYVVSDHHLGIVSGDSERTFLAFLRSLSGRAKSLVINGDLFDFWFEWKYVMPRTGFRVLAALADLTDASIPVLWIGGNHDCWGGDVLRQQVGVNYMLGKWEGKIGSWRTLIEHGDGLRPKGDRGYRALRAVIRHPAAVAAMRVLHPDVGSWLATRSSSVSRHSRDHDDGAELHSIARARLALSDAPDLYMLGHNHVAALDQVATGGVYANAGSFSEKGTFLCITESSVELKSFSLSAGENRLHLVDLRAQKSLADVEKLPRSV
jgi:UDP-2,3-diacylglucosamine hydrolase